MRSLVLYSIVALAICSLMGLAAPTLWVADLFNHFRPHAVIAGAALAIIAFFCDKKWAVAALAIVLLNAGLMAKRIQQTAGISTLVAAGESAKPFSILSSNVFTPNRQYPLVLAMMAREKPDIAVFVETNERWINAMENLERDYPHTFKHSREDNFGIVIYSKRPFTSRVESVGNLGLPASLLDFGDFLLIAIHTIPPISENSMNDNRIYLKAIADIASNSKVPVIIAGDFNSTLWSDAIEPIITANLKRINPTGLAYTWPTHFPPFALQIDHFFAKGIKAADFKVLEYVGSDHYPIRGDFVLSRP